MTTPIYGSDGNMPSRNLPTIPYGDIGGNMPERDLDYEKWLSDARRKLAEQQQQIKTLEAKKKALKKPNPKDKKATAAYKAKLAAYDSTLKKYKALEVKYKGQVADYQNRVWEASGQYDKLLKGTERDAYMAINALFKTYGLDSLAGKIYDYVKNGYSADTISILLQDTKEYKTRFSGNEARKTAGLPVLSPAEYLATESTYRQIMQEAGLPPGFYDSPTDFSGWIGKNISPKEVQSRVDLATQATILSNPDYRKALNQMGIDNGQITAYFLDTDRALPYIQKAAATAQIGAEALTQNLTFDVGFAEEMATRGISAEQARSGYAQIASELDTMRALGMQYGEEWNQRTGEQAAFGLGADAAQKKGRLLSRERGAFSGGSGGARAGLGSRGGAK
jgi:hypothetical protein